MPIISPTDRKSASGRLVVAWIYALLALGGLTMVYPFLVTLTGSTATAFDYERRSALPGYATSREDRWLRMLCGFFPPSHRGSLRQLRAYFPDFPSAWSTWAQIGDDRNGSDAWARRQLARLEDPAQRRHLETLARDYRDFAAAWDLRETVLAFDMRYVAPFLRRRYGTLDRFNAAWEVSVDDFAKITAPEWSGEPIDQSGYVPEEDTRYHDLLLFREEYRRNRYTPFLAASTAYAGYLRPATVRYLWEDNLLDTAPSLAKEYEGRLPFPVPASASAPLRVAWGRFLRERFPLRHVEIAADGPQRAAFLRFLQGRFRTLDYMNRLLELNARRWEDRPLTATVPSGPTAKVWLDFVRTKVPVAAWQLRETLPELAFQRQALTKYGSLAGVNAAYGLRLGSLEELPVPFGEALLGTFAHHEAAFAWEGMTGNYRAVADYLFQQGRAVPNTVILVVLTLVVALTVNPLAGYALSRFRLRRSEQVILFVLATMAFPAAVAAIPGFLLLRDMGLLNSFAALVLPGAANGMTIFLLKGFFDSLPRELYEAAAIDGAPEWQVFWRISLPLVKPILAVSLLNAFLGAYNGWEWALIVCQDPKVWTVAVWTYQFSQALSAQPYTVMAAFMLSSLPVLAVFLACQKVILRGIILPQMK
jgi:multiple sugar transport system permease protein